METLDPTLSGITGTFNGRALNYPTDNVVETYFKYSQGSTIASPPSITSKQLIKALSGSTALPGFDVVQGCTQYSYQVGI